jgi:GT2 family glycosyltransferase
VSVPPLVSVIVPTHGRPAALATCLDALAEQSYPLDALEIVVVDDGGPDGATVASVVADRDRSARLLRQSRAGPAQARNTGAALARGIALAFTDDDCAPAPGWIESLVDRWVLDPDCLIGGITVNGVPGDAYAATSQALIDYLYEYWNSDAHNGRFFTSNNILLSADQFRRLGGFSGAFSQAAAEDRDFCDRWRGAGWRLVSAPLAVVRHAHGMTFRSFVRQHVRYGRGAAVFHRERAARASSRMALEPWWFYAGMAAAPFRRARGLRAWRMAVLMILTQVAGGVGFGAERFRAAWLRRFSARAAARRRRPAVPESGAARAVAPGAGPPASRRSP